MRENTWRSGKRMEKEFYATRENNNFKYKITKENEKMNSND